MNLPLKHSLFHELGCKPFNDVILHHPNWEIHCPDSPMSKLEELAIVKYQDWMATEMAIEPIPDKLCDNQRCTTWNYIYAADNLLGGK